MKKILLCLALLVSIPACPASAAETAIPDWLTRAIIQVESGGNAHALNLSGKSHFPGNLEEALRLIATAQERGGSYDVGLMQINRFWIDKYGIPPESLLDPDANMAWGKRILAWEIERHGLTWRAVARYHSPDEERGRRYAWKVYQAARPMNIMREANHAHKKESGNNLPDAGGIQRGSGRSGSGRIIHFHLPENDQPGPAGQKP